jgi:hypothetical protein
VKQIASNIDSVRLLALSLTVALISTACTKEIKPNLRTTTPTLVIEGNITNLSGPYTVLLSNSVIFYDSNKVVPVSGGHVRISDNAGNTDSLTEVQPGIYHTSTIVGTPGRTYHLSVNSSGKQYDAYSTMPPPVPIDTFGILSFNLFGKSRSISSFVFIDPAGVLNYYNAYAYINHQKQDKANPDNDVGSDGMPIQLFLSTDSSFKKNDTLMGELDAIDLPMYNYWNTLTGSTLSGQSAAPGNPTSNISNGALGYFSAYSPTFTHTIVIDSIGFHRIN